MTPKIAIWILLIIYAIGLSGLLYSEKLEIAADMTPYNLLLCFLMLLFFNKKWDAGFFIAMAIIVLSGFFIEYIGVQTGLIFGRYSFGSVLGFKWNGIPLLIGIHWFIIIYCSRDLAQRISSNTIFSILLAAFFMILYDYLMEPVAIRFGLWQWNSGTIPLHNTLGWLAVSIVLQATYKNTVKQSPNAVAISIFIIHLVYFSVIGLYFKALPYVPAY